MTIDKRITHRKNFRDAGYVEKAYAPSSKAPASAKSSPFTSGMDRQQYSATQTQTGAVKGAGPKGTDAFVSSGQGQTARQQYIDNLNRNNASRFEPSFFNRTYKPVTLNTVGARNQRSTNNPLANLLGFITGIPFGLFNQGKGGLTSLANKFNNLQGDFREKFTGYRTQEEYDNARQQRINLNRINTIQNTLNTKYTDGDYSNTDLDERLAALKSQMGIVPNTPEQDAQQFLDFNNDLAINTKQSPIPTQNVNASVPTEYVSMYSPDVKLANAGYAIESPDANLRFPESGINTLRFPEFNPIDTQVTPSREYPFFPYSESV